MTDLLIKDSEISEHLGIPRETLLSIRRKLNLVPQADYIKLGKTEACFYTASGIKKLHSAFRSYAPYRDKAKLLKALVYYRKEQILHARIRQTVLENSQIVKLNTGNFIPENRVAAILRIAPKTLKNNFPAIQRSPYTLSHETEFRCIEEVTYYSFRGIDKLSQYFATSHSNPATRAWCKNVTIHTETVAKNTADTQSKLIEKAKGQARTRDNNTCQITQEKPTLDNPITLAVHHLYDRTHYPHLADSLDNLLTIKETIHQEFHQYQGGSSKPCTVDDFARFIQLAYPEYPDALNILHRFRTRLYAPYAPQPLTFPPP